MRILVTGDRGYIGSVLVPMLQREGHTAVGLDTGWYDDCGFGPQVGRYEQRTADAREVRPRDLVGFDAVVHLAGLPTTVWQLGDVLIDGAALTAGAVRLAASARDAGVRRFIHLDFDDLLWPPPQTPEDQPGQENNVVAFPGLGKGHVAAQIAGLAGDDFTTLTLGHAAPFGSSPRLRLDILLNAVIVRALVDDVVHIPLGTGAWYPFVHVKDVSRALILALRTSVSGAGTFEVLRPRDAHPMSAATAHISAITGATMRFSETPARRPEDPGSGHPPLPGFRPRYRLPDGIRELCRALSRNGLSPQFQEDMRFDRRRVLATLSRNRASAADAEPP